MSFVLTISLFTLSFMLLVSQFDLYWNNSYGFGNFDVYFDGTLEGSGGDFESEDTISFGSPCPSSAPTGCISFQLDLLTDGYPVSGLTN